MASSNKIDEREFYFLQPQLLTKEGLIELLELRCVKLTNIHAMSKEELVEVFQRVGVPLPQRTYRENRRGKLLTKLRTNQEKLKEKQKPVEMSSNVTIGFNEASTSRYQGRPVGGDRLKPPPDAINFERKKIKLSSTISAKSHELDNIQIKRVKRDDIKNGNCLKEESHKSNSTAQEMDKIRSNSCTNVGEKSSHKIVLKRPHTSTVEKQDSNDGGTMSKKEKKKITWP